jgi:hypothetical protein
VGATTVKPEVRRTMAAELPKVPLPDASSCCCSLVTSSRRGSIAGYRAGTPDDLRWKGKKDQYLFTDAASRGFDALVVLDVEQLADPALCRALKRSGLYHVSLRQGRTVKGKTGCTDHGPPNRGDAIRPS